MQALVVVEGQALCEVPEATILKSLTTLIAVYYCFFYYSFPKPPPAAGMLLFVQELIMLDFEERIKKPTRYSALIDSLLADYIVHLITVLKRNLSLYVLFTPYFHLCLPFHMKLFNQYL